MLFFLTKIDTIAGLGNKTAKNPTSCPLWIFHEEVSGVSGGRAICDFNPRAFVHKCRRAGKPVSLFGTLKRGTGLRKIKLSDLSAKMGNKDRNKFEGNIPNFRSIISWQCLEDVSIESGRKLWIKNGEAGNSAGRWNKRLGNHPPAEETPVIDETGKVAEGGPVCPVLEKNHLKAERDRETSGDQIGYREVHQQFAWKKCTNASITNHSFLQLTIREENEKKWRKNDILGNIRSNKNHRKYNNNVQILKSLELLFYGTYYGNLAIIKGSENCDMKHHRISKTI